MLVDAGEDFASDFDDGAGVEDAPPPDDEPPDEPPEDEPPPEDELAASAPFFSAARESVR